MMRSSVLVAALLVVAPAWAQPPNESGTVQDVARERPGDLRNSCQSSGGSWAFVDAIVDRLQARDRRWGYNAKRGNMNDPSHDAIAYYRGAGQAEGSQDVAIFDVIGGHCGSNPQPAWIDQTQATADAGTIGRYIGCRPGRDCRGGRGGGTPTTPDYGAELAAIRQQLAALTDLLMGRYGTLLETAARDAGQANQKLDGVQSTLDHLPSPPAPVIPCMSGAIGLPGFLGGSRTVTLCPKEP